MFRRMYEKVVLDQKEASTLYKEDLILGEDNRIVFKKRRYFQEILGVSSYTDGCKTIWKGESMKLGINLPAYIPAREPCQNWFQVAMKPLPEFKDPLSLEARYKGFLPCFIVHELGRKNGWIMVDDNLDFNFADYALFIYDRADYGQFITEVEKAVERLLNGRKIVRDRIGNTVLVSDSLTDQAMMLMPLDLLVGGKTYIQRMWREVIHQY